MAKTPEATVRDPVVKWAKSVGLTHFRNHMGRGVKKGRPDDEFVRASMVAFVEFKAPGKEPTPLQDHVISELKKDNTAAAWFDNSEQAIAYLKGFFGIV